MDVRVATPFFAQQPGREFINSSSSLLLAPGEERHPSISRMVINQRGATGSPPPISLAGSYQGMSRRQSIQEAFVGEGMRRRVELITTDSYIGAIVQLGIVFLHMLGAFYLFYEPLTYNVLGIFCCLGLYFSFYLLAEYRSNNWERRKLHCESLYRIHRFIAFSHAFVALRYLALLTSSPLSLGICFLSSVFIWINASRSMEFKAEEIKIINRNLL